MADDNVKTGRVEKVEHQPHNGQALLYLQEPKRSRAGKLFVVAKTPQAQGVEVGDTVHYTMDPKGLPNTGTFVSRVPHQAGEPWADRQANDTPIERT